MEAKDTVMNSKELRAIRKKVRELCPELSADREGDIAQATAEAQAAISFKAGRKEVVKWVEKYTDVPARRRIDWQAFLKDIFKDDPELLKEWGIEEGKGEQK